MRASRSHTDQWVVARRPSSRPASASRKAPLHTEATRGARGGAARSPVASAWSLRAPAVPSPPATTRVSTGPRRPASGSVARPRPDDETTVPPGREATVTAEAGGGGKRVGGGETPAGAGGTRDSPPR